MGIVLLKNSVLQDVKIWKKKGHYIIHIVLPWIYSSSNKDQGDPLPYPFAPHTITLTVRCTCRSTKTCGCRSFPRLRLFYLYPTIADAQTKSELVSKVDLMPVFITANFSRHHSKCWRLLSGNTNYSRYDMSSKEFIWPSMILVVTSLPSFANHYLSTIEHVVKKWPLTVNSLR